MLWGILPFPLLAMIFPLDICPVDVLKEELSFCLDFKYSLRNRSSIKVVITFNFSYVFKLLIFYIAIKSFYGSGIR